ncbi:MAG: thioesterase family protein [Planctomycetota bacterium]
MAHEYHRQRRVEFSDTDTAGIAHFSSFFRYMEETEHEFLRSLGLSVHPEPIDGKRYGFPRLASRCEFSKPVRFEDVVDIWLRVARRGKSSITYQFVLRSDGEQVAIGETSVVCCELEGEGKIARADIPETFSEIESAPYELLKFRETKT